MEYKNYYLITLKKSSFPELQNVFEILQIWCEKKSTGMLVEWHFISTRIFLVIL